MSYAKTAGNFADNIIATTRLSNNAMFANFDAYETVVQRQRDDLKELSRLATNNARTFEHTSGEAARAQITSKVTQNSCLFPLNFSFPNTFQKLKS